VVNVRDNAEITYLFHTRHQVLFSACQSRQTGRKGRYLSSDREGGILDNFSKREVTKTQTT